MTMQSYWYLILKIDTSEACALELHSSKNYTMIFLCTYGESNITCSVQVVAILFRFAHKSSWQPFRFPRKQSPRLFTRRVTQQKRHPLKVNARFCTRDPTGNRTPVTGMRILCPSR